MHVTDLQSNLESALLSIQFKAKKIGDLTCLNFRTLKLKLDCLNLLYLLISHLN